MTSVDVPVGDAALEGKPAGGPGDRARSLRRSTRRYRILGYVILLGVWYVAAKYLVSGPALPEPLDVLVHMGEIISNGAVATHFAATLTRTGLALLILYPLGCIVGIAMGSRPWIEDSLRDLINMLIQLPGLLFVLLMIIVFGLNPVGPYFAIVITTFPFVAVQLWEGVKSIPTELGDMAKAYGVSRRDKVRHILLPGLAPYMFAAITYAVGFGWKLVMLTELFGGSSGVGFMIRINFGLFAMDRIFAWVFLFLGLVILLERLILQPLGKHVFRWRAASFDRASAAL